MNKNCLRSLFRPLISLFVSVVVLSLLCTPFISSASARFTPILSSAKDRTFSFPSPANASWSELLNRASNTPYFTFPSIWPREFLENLESNKDKSFQYGLGPDNVPFAVSKDGTKARYLDMTSTHVKLQLTNRRDIGEMEIQRFPANTWLLRFESHKGNSLFVRAIPDPTNDDPARMQLELVYKNKRAEAKYYGGASNEPVSKAGRDLNVIIEGVRNDKPLARLIQATNAFCTKAVLSGIMLSSSLHEPLSFLSCALDILECIERILLYAGSIGTLILLCGETFGLTCLNAILLHSVLGPIAVLKCNDAIQNCGATPPTAPRFAEACNEIGGFWSEGAGDCLPSWPTSQTVCESAAWIWNPIADVCQTDPPPPCDLFPDVCDSGGWSFQWCTCIPIDSPILLDVAGNGLCSYKCRRRS